MPSKLVIDGFVEVESGKDAATITVEEIHEQCDRAATELGRAIVARRDAEEREHELERMYKTLRHNLERVVAGEAVGAECHVLGMRLPAKDFTAELRRRGLRDPMPWRR